MIMKERLFIEDSKKDIQIEEMLLKEFSNAMIGGIELQETPLGTRIVIYTMAPGIVIGTGGEKIRMMTESLKNRFGLKNPQIDVQKIRNPDLNPAIVAQNICQALEKGLNYKKIGNHYIAKIMRAGARGCEIIIAGKLGGEKSRTEKFYAGFVEKSGTREAVLKGTCVATPKLGNIGIKVFITLKDYSRLAEAPTQEPEAAGKPDVVAESGSKEEGPAENAAAPEAEPKAEEAKEPEKTGEEKAVD